MYNFNDAVVESQKSSQYKHSQRLLFRCPIFPGSSCRRCSTRNACRMKSQELLLDQRAGLPTLEIQANLTCVQQAFTHGSYKTRQFCKTQQGFSVSLCPLTCCLWAGTITAASGSTDLWLEAFSPLCLPVGNFQVFLQLPFAKSVFIQSAIKPYILQLGLFIIQMP